MNDQRQSPIIITARLLWGIRVGDTTISIDPADERAEGRIVCTYHIDTPTWSYSADDLHSGCGPASPYSLLESLLSFLSAAAEAYSYGPESDNFTLFPEQVMQWAASHEDALSCALLDMEEGA